MIQFVVELVSYMSHKISDRYNHLTKAYLYCGYPHYWRPFTATFTSRTQSVKWTDRILTKPWTPRPTHITSRVGPRLQWYTAAWPSCKKQKQKFPSKLFLTKEMLQRRKLVPKLKEWENKAKRLNFIDHQGEEFSDVAFHCLSWVLCESHKETPKTTV